MRAVRRRAGLMLIALGLVATGCKGDKGVPGTPAADHGSITGTVKDASGSPIAAASVTTVPPTVTAQTDGSGSFTLAAIPIGAYDLVASKVGYADGKLTAVGVGTGAPVQVSLLLVATAPTVGSVSGTIRGRTGQGVSAAVPGAQVCVEGASLCTTSASDGTYTLSGVSPGFVFVSAVASGFLPGETRQAANVAAGGTMTGVDVTVSGQPPSSATYVGSSVCVGCHDGSKSGVPDVVSDWKSSSHFNLVDRTVGSVDVNGWTGAPPSSDCTTPNTHDTGVVATDPNVPVTTQDDGNREVYLVRFNSSCTYEFEMAFNTASPDNSTGVTVRQNGVVVVNPNDTIIPVTGSIGGVATSAGQCGNGGILPADQPCSADLGGTGSTSAKGWWQQEYLVDIGTSSWTAGASKPSWVTWDTSETPTDALVLPAAWNQRPQQWVPASDYNPTQAGTLLAACSGCHETGLSLSFATDANGNVIGLSSYSAASHDIGCEKCHGPGSSHASAAADPTASNVAQLIINPRYLTAQSEREVCGQCHVNDFASVSPAGVASLTWNDQATLGGGNFIPGVHKLSDFQTTPAYGNSSDYFNGFPITDHVQYVDLQGSVHANNSIQKLTCSDCHSGHRSDGGPVQFQRSDPQTGDQYVFQGNEAVLRNDVLCLSCHAAQGWFGAVTVADVARYHVSTGGTVLKNGASFGPSSTDEAQSTSVIASAVDSHMWFHSGMSAFFDPTGLTGSPSGRCSSCHMAKTTATGSFYSGLDANGHQANVIGDVSSHVFRVATADDSLASLTADLAAAAAGTAPPPTWDAVMPNACGSCHAAYWIAPPP